MPDTTGLERALGSPITSIVPLQVDEGGSHSRVFRVECGARAYILRQALGRQGFYTAYLPPGACADDWLDSHWANEQARRLGIPAPEIVHTDRKKRLVLMAELPGLPIVDYEKWADGCPYDEACFGSILAQLHSATASGYGPVDDFGRTYYSSWAAFLSVVADVALAACLRRRSIGEALHRLLRGTWYPRIAGLWLERPALLHLESLGFANILYDPNSGTITGFLDYEDCIGGDPLFELTSMCYYYGERSSTQPYFDYGRFEDGYGRWPADERLATLYRPFMLLQKLSWIDAEGARANHHRQALWQLCQRIGAF